MDSGREVRAVYSISLTVTNSPTLPKHIQVPHYCPVWFHVLISGDAIIVPTQPSDVVLVGTREDDFWEEQTGVCKEAKLDAQESVGAFCLTSINVAIKAHSEAKVSGQLNLLGVHCNSHTINWTKRRSNTFPIDLHKTQ